MTKSTKAKMKAGAWSPAARAKAAATRAANAAKKASTTPNTQDALAYLLKAEKSFLRSKSTRVGAFETLVFLALNALRGEL